MDTQNDAMFERRYIFKKPSFLVSILDFGGVTICNYTIPNVMHVWLTYVVCLDFTIEINQHAGTYIIHGLYWDRSVHQSIRFH